MTLNFYKVVNKSNLKKSDYIDLRLSLEELEYIPEKIKYFLDIGFIEDSSNEWRNASVIVDNSYEKVKYKFHGTSTKPKGKHARFMALSEIFKF